MIVEFSSTARKQLRKLDFQVQKKMKEYKDTLQSLENPRERGKPLVGSWSGFWRYRVGNYRLICEIQDEKLIILVLEIGHRKDIYK